ncbi:acid protease [Mycena latifolia]|nr:acid protease [Mycena latifolia]KAJ7451645.1 acid protease [Mycena latifolia]
MSQSATHNVSFKTNVVRDVREIQKRDCARSKHLLAGHHPHGPMAFHDLKKAHHHHSGGSSGGPSPSSPCDPTTTINVTDAAVTYLATVGVGSPATNYDLLIDTGSSNTWISAVDKPYKPTSTSKDTRKKFQITYGSGDCAGSLYTDQITLGPKLVIQDQVVGVADQASDMNGMDGILGIGPVDLTQGTDSSNEEIPTVTDNLLKQKLINDESIGIYYEPTTSANAANGSLSFGGPDSSKYTGKLNYFPITPKSPASAYWGIEQSISYGGQEIMSCCPGIADTGTTLVMLPSSVFQAYQKATGAVLDPSSQLLTVTEDQYNNMQSMIFNIGGVKHELCKNAQIWPRSMADSIGCPKGKICLIFADMGQINVDQDGLCFINGFTFLQRFYSVYDVSKQQVGFATTEHTMATTN